MKIFCDAHLRISHLERQTMYNMLKNNNKITFLQKKFVKIFIKNIININLLFHQEVMD